MEIIRDVSYFFLFDVKKDGLSDYEFVRSRSFSDEYDTLKIELFPFRMNELATPFNNSNLVDTVPIMDKLDSNSNWVNSPCILYNSYINQSDTLHTGLWQNASRKYIGISLLQRKIPILTISLLDFPYSHNPY